MNKKKIIDNFFNFLNGKVKYVILTKRSQIYSETNDIDIITESFVRFKDIVNLFLKKNNIFLVQEIHHKNYGKHLFFIALYKNKYISFNIDVYQTIAFNNKVFFSSSFLLKSKNKEKNFNFLNKNKISIYYLIKNLIKDNISSDNLDYIMNNLNQKTNYFKSFFPSTYNEIFKNFNEKNYKYFFNNRNKLLDELLNNCISFPYYYLYLLTYFFKRVLKPNGLIISFIGPDGSGKSSLIKKIRYSQLPFRNIHYYHFSPNIEFNPFDKSTFIMKRKENHNLILSYLKIFYIVLTFNIFYPLIFIKKIKSSLIVFDRYYYDLLADCNRLRIKENILIPFFVKFIPKPDLVFVLTAEPFLIHSRKPENSLTRTKMLLKKYQAILNNSNFIEICTNGNILKSHKLVLSKIYEKLIK